MLLKKVFLENNALKMATALLLPLKLELSLLCRYDENENLFHQLFFAKNHFNFWLLFYSFHQVHLLMSIN